VSRAKFMIKQAKSVDDNNLDWLNQWYLAQCDRNWEHGLA